MHTIDLRDSSPTRAELARLVPRAGMDVTAASAVAAHLIDDGDLGPEDEALLYHERNYHRPDPLG